jgi:hypothetical protein
MSVINAQLGRLSELSQCNSTFCIAIACITAVHRCRGCCCSKAQRKKPTDPPYVMHSLQQSWLCLSIVICTWSAPTLAFLAASSAAVIRAKSTSCAVAATKLHAASTPSIPTAPRPPLPEGFYDENLLDKLALTLFRNLVQNEIGFKSDKVGYEGLIEEAHVSSQALLYIAATVHGHSHFRRLFVYAIKLSLFAHTLRCVTPQNYMVDQRATPEQQRDMVERCLKVSNSVAILESCSFSRRHQVAVYEPLQRRSVRFLEQPKVLRMFDAAR